MAASMPKPPTPPSEQRRPSVQRPGSPEESTRLFGDESLASSRKARREKASAEPKPIQGVAAEALQLMSRQRTELTKARRALEQVLDTRRESDRKMERLQQVLAKYQPPEPRKPVDIGAVITTKWGLGRKGSKRSAIDTCLLKRIVQFEDTPGTHPGCQGTDKGDPLQEQPTHVQCREWQGFASESEGREHSKVKNTFIDVRPDCVDDDDYDDTVSAAASMMKQRQFSEPAPTRQFSSRQTSSTEMHAPISMLGPNSLVEEEEDESDGYAKDDLPDGKGSPTRQETEALGTSPINRQVTEVHWPTWGMETAYSAPFDPNLLPMTPDLRPGGLPRGMPTEAADAGQWPQAFPCAAVPMAAVPAAMLQAPGVQAAVKPEGSKDIPPDWRNKTTVMLRNLPNKYSQQMLLEDLNTSGFLGTFDFLYLPIDPETNANRGYCFINFTDPSFAWMLKCTYEGRKMGRFNSDKVVSVAPAALQGFEANYAHYSTARVNRGDPSTRPLFLRECAGAVTQDQQRRRGGRRSQGSLIDIAARQQRKQQVPEGGYSSFPAGTGPTPPGVVESGKKGGKPSAGKGGGGEGNPQPRFCPFCGGETKPDFKFCQFCGASLSFGGKPA
ncbi:ML3 [Symbiodinium natans]|uniref:ML3 protein n=1 Tax=Symbiodinium natans TaxID=878477 RepID=A0A812LFD6_9DINO|nr:ML3 [Symbiodinium natans]